MVTLNELIALRLSEEELLQLDEISSVQGDGNRSATIRSLISQAHRIMGLDKMRKVAVLAPKCECEADAGDPQYEDGDLAHDQAREESEK